MKENKITSQIIDAAIRVHRFLGPGLLESVYETCLIHELKKTNLKIEVQKALPIIYEGNQLNAGYRVDILVENLVIIELKAVEVVHRVHHAQVLTYMKLSNCRVGLIINFNVALLKLGIKRFIL